MTQDLTALVNVSDDVLLPAGRLDAGERDLVEQAAWFAARPDSTPHYLQHPHADARRETRVVHIVLLVLGAVALAATAGLLLGGGESFAVLLGMSGILGGLPAVLLAGDRAGRRLSGSHRPVATQRAFETRPHGPGLPDDGHVGFCVRTRVHAGQPVVELLRVEAVTWHSPRGEGQHGETKVTFTDGLDHAVRVLARVSGEHDDIAALAAAKADLNARAAELEQRAWALYCERRADGFALLDRVRDEHALATQTAVALGA